MWGTNPMPVPSAVGHDTFFGTSFRAVDDLLGAVEHFLERRLGTGTLLFDAAACGEQFGVWMFRIAVAERE